MQRATIAMLTGAALVSGTLAMGALPARAETPASPATATCEAQLAHYRERLERKIMPTWLKQRYASAILAAYESCRSDHAKAWDRIERTLG